MWRRAAAMRRQLAPGSRASRSLCRCLCRCRMICRRAPTRSHWAYTICKLASGCHLQAPPPPTPRAPARTRCCWIRSRCPEHCRLQIADCRLFDVIDNSRTYAPHSFHFLSGDFSPGRAKITRQKERVTLMLTQEAHQDLHKAVELLELNEVPAVREVYMLADAPVVLECR